MAYVTLPAISFRQMPGFIRQVAVIYSDSAIENQYLKSVGNIMLNLIALRFAMAKDPEGNPWKSTAPETKFGGRFALDYRNRPSGRPVSASSKRLFDTGELMRSYKVLYLTSKKVVVGPTGSRNTTIALAASENWNNDIVGWTKKDVALATKELEAFFIKRIRGY